VATVIVPLAIMTLAAGAIDPAAWTSSSAALAPALAITALGALIMLGRRDRTSVVAQLDTASADRLLLSLAQLAGELHALFLSSAVALVMLILLPLALHAIPAAVNPQVLGWIAGGWSGLIALALYSAVFAMIRVAVLEMTLFDITVTSAHAVLQETTPRPLPFAPVPSAQDFAGAGSPVGLLH